MKKAILLSALLTCFLLPILHAQPPCGFDIRHNKLIQTDPTYARNIETNDAAIRSYIAKHPELLTGKTKNAGDQNRMMATYTIPVVVHVMHTGLAIGTTYNPTDAQIIGAINYLNQVYAGTYPGMTPFSPGGAAGDIDIQFALAQRTPSCGATNGIDRVDASSIPNYTALGVNANNTNGVDELTLKNFARWNPSDYYNIWVVNKIDGADGTAGQFIAGFAYFAGAPATLDGTIMLATQMTAGAKTLPHEIGHALNVYHPFQGSNGYNTTPMVADCPANANCNTQGDQVCDTDPIYNNLNTATGIYSFACRSGANICAAPNNYTINTENNIMSYTNCFTLFTNGQKARMTAAMTSMPSRQSLVAPGNLALVPCGTNINFTLASSSQVENISGTLTGCRRYTDYTYQMSIGGAPSATATATLTFSGTAVQGIDYDVTTNGNFASPSSVLTFNSGLTTPQSFTVRVYDDADVESNETAILDFTVNNGGGNAAKGTNTPTFTLTIGDNDIAPSGSGSVVANIGLGNVGITQPFRGQFSDSRTQILYTAAELGAAGITNSATITSIAFEIFSKVSTGPFNGFTVKMKNTNTATLPGGGQAFETGTTQVFTGNYTTVAGFNTITLTTPFIWDGTSNLLVELCYDNSTATGAGVGTDGVVGTTMTGYCHFDRADATTGCTMPNATFVFGGSGGRPDIRINATLIATPIETVATSNKNQQMGVGSSDYFFSNNNRLMMRMTGINASLGCVNSVLEGAGTTWSSYFGGQRSAKVFAVTPTTNGGTAGYTISLYFDNPELAGKTAGTLRIAKTSAASAAASNASNTILVVPTVTTLGSGTTIFTATFTGFSRFFLVDAGVTLPVNLTDFTAHATDQKNTLLNWTTGSEQSNKQFDIEISNDATNFALLSSVLSQGNSSTEQHYEYLHIKPQTGTSYYRLKQVDIDGKFKYSQIAAVTISSDLVKPFVYPVPSRNIITVNFGSLINKASMEILTADMKIVKRETVNQLSLKKDINIQGLSNGVYFIRLTLEKGTQLLRFVKE